MADPLFELKNYFVLGNFQAAINAGNAIKPAALKTDVEKAERGRSTMGNGENQIEKKTNMERV
jgi:hypothetical protein